jgi:hypothetical protein
VRTSAGPCRHRPPQSCAGALYFPPPGVVRHAQVRPFTHALEPHERTHALSHTAHGCHRTGIGHPSRATGDPLFPAVVVLSPRIESWPKRRSFLHPYETRGPPEPRHGACGPPQLTLAAGEILPCRHLLEDFPRTRVSTLQNPKRKFSSACRRTRREGHNESPESRTPVHSWPLAHERTHQDVPQKIPLGSRVNCHACGHVGSSWL